MDIDVDIEGGKRSQVLSHLRRVYGSDRVTNVVTFKTETTKSAILTAARGLGIDVDVASYIASLVPADRGMLRSLSQCMYGDEENDMKPIKQFVFEMTENYPELWDVASKIEGLVCGIGMHAGGIIFVDEPFTESTALMRAPDGTLCTQYDLHNCESVSLIKYDLLSVEAMDKIHTCIDLLCNYGYAEQKDTLKETYESIIGIYNLDRNSSRMWDMVYNHEINSLFQMEKDSGVNGIKLARPTSVDDLATLNSVIRLMAQEKGGEMPLNKFARFKEDIQQWYNEMTEWGLTEDEQELLKEQLQVSYGICESQEKFMTLVQTPECGGFDLMWADRLRKSIAKKNPKEFDQLTTEYFANAEAKGLSVNLCNYVWNVLVAYSRGYGFNSSHTLAYSLIALQEMNLAYRFPIIFWNCACLIVDSGGSNEENDDSEEDVYIEEEHYYNEMEEFGADDSDDDIDSSYEEEDCDGYPAEVCQMSSGKKKKKVKTTNYGKIATAIGKIKTAGTQIAPPDINNSTFTFSPDVNNNIIRYGLRGITRIGQDLIYEIINNRPYSSLKDFLSKVKVNKPQMVNLIKSGMFDCFNDRIKIMQQYIDIIADKKKRITLQNMKMLIDFNLIPEQYSHQCKVYNFNRYLKKMKLNNYYGLDNRALYFYEQHFPVDELEITNTTESGMMIKQTIWDKFYQSNMDIIRPYIKEHNQELLTAINNRLYKEQWDKYCKGSISKWEMDSISCYIHEHELECINHNEYCWTDFNNLSKNPEIDKILYIKGRHIPLFKLYQIAGTVLDRDKSKKTVTLLTTTGVVNVKIYGAFEEYDKQISVIGEDGKKHVIEKSMFSRGSKIIVTGIRRDDTFLAKVYKNTGRHRVERIIDVIDNKPIISKERGKM